LKFPTLDQALAAVDALESMGGTVGAAAGLVGIVADLFDNPKDQQALKDRYAEQKARTDAALDRLENAIDAAQADE
jgi:hypothetical protein